MQRSEAMAASAAPVEDPDFALAMARRARESCAALAGDGAAGMAQLYHELARSGAVKEGEVLRSMKQVLRRDSKIVVDEVPDLWRCRSCVVRPAIRYQQRNGNSGHHRTES